MGLWSRNRARLARLEEQIAAILKALSEKPENDQPSLLQTFLAMEQSRLEQSAKVELRQAEIKAKQMELELADLERVGTEKRKATLFAEEMKVKKREWAAKARAAKAQKRIFNAAQQAFPEVECEECRALLERRAPRHAGDLIRHAQQRHSEQLQANGQFDS